MIRQATEDPSWQAWVLTRVPLRYSAGADPAQDRPAHVRAGSGIHWIGGELAVIQDDARFVALVHPTSVAVRALALPAGRDGVRLFDDRRGNKNEKLDLEASLVVEVEGDELLLAFGSGSKAARDQIAVVNAGRGSAVIRDAGALYTSLRDCHAFAGSQLNVEGAILMDGVVRLFNRGNGRSRHGLSPVNASVDIEWVPFWRYLSAPDDAPVPGLHHVEQYDLGEHQGQRLTFTDACWLGKRVLFAAAAEDSPDATEDGPVAGSALGVIEPSGEVRYTMLRGQDGGAFRGKVEGVARSRTEPNRVYLVTDADDSDVPAELCIAELSPWPA